MKKLLILLGTIILISVNAFCLEINSNYYVEHEDNFDAISINVSEQIKKTNICLGYYTYSVTDYIKHVDRYRLRLTHKLNDTYNLILMGAVVPKAESYKGSFFNAGIEYKTDIKNTPLTTSLVWIHRRHENYKDGSGNVLTTPFKTNQNDVKINFKSKIKDYAVEAGYVQNINYSNKITSNTRNALWLEHYTGDTAGFLKYHPYGSIMSPALANNKLNFKVYYGYIKFLGRRDFQHEVIFGPIYKLTKNLTMYYLPKWKTFGGHQDRFFHMIGFKLKI